MKIRNGFVSNSSSSSFILSMNKDQVNFVELFVETSILDEKELYDIYGYNWGYDEEEKGKIKEKINKILEENGKNIIVKIEVPYGDSYKFDDENKNLEKLGIKVLDSLY